MLALTVHYNYIHFSCPNRSQTSAAHRDLCSCSCSCPIYCCLLSRVQADCPVVIKLCRSFAAPLPRRPFAVVPCSLARHFHQVYRVIWLTAERCWEAKAKAAAACVKRDSNQKTICQMSLQMAAATASVASRRQLGGRQSVNTLWHIHTHTHTMRDLRKFRFLGPGCRSLLLLATSRMLMLIKITA